MGFYYRDMPNSWQGHKIQCFRPDDTENEFYVECGYESHNLLDILNKAVKKWPLIEMSEIEIEADYIHTDCIGYDQYDAGDYTKYLRISRVAKNSQ
jgi:hypothetical protein